MWWIVFVLGVIATGLAFELHLADKRADWLALQLQLQDTRLSTARAAVTRLRHRVTELQRGGTSGGWS